MDAILGDDDGEQLRHFAFLARKAAHGSANTNGSDSGTSSTTSVTDADVVEDGPLDDEELALAVSPHDGGNVVSQADLPLSDGGVPCGCETAERPKCLQRLACRCSPRAC